MFIHLCTHNARPRAWYRWGLRKGLIPTPKVNYPGQPFCSHTCRPTIKHRADARWPSVCGCHQAAHRLHPAYTQAGQTLLPPACPHPQAPEGPLRASSSNSGGN